MPVAAGTRLGPYEVVELLGSGGMGEVYRARDPRLGRDVALKVLHDDVASDPSRLKRFEIEARAVAALNHPHVLTVHDVGSHDGRPYVVSELLEGESLREVLSRRLPTPRQIVGWAVQAAQGLSAAHRKGIVHRDLKPENLFLTTDGRIKILDFGLARQSAPGIDSREPTESSPTKPGVVMGTLAYMSPEQVQGQPVDPRSDLFSFGVVLYELLGRKHPFRRETVAATVGAILQEPPAPLVSLDPTIPRAVDGIVRRCLEKRREDRFQGAHDLALALEAVLAAPTGSAALEEVEERSPYPGLASFTEKDAPVFFGREAEVAALWEKIRQKRLLAVIGPSGAGKTSFLRAGVIAARPEGWGAIHATPGANPGLGLAHALTPELAGDPDAIRDLLDGVTELAQTGGTDRVVSAAKRWRARHAEVLVVVDQLEELFTLSPPATQERFAVLLGRLADDADVHVVLSLRDDFLLRCFEQPPLAPSVTPLTVMLPLKRDALRRALVEPALRRGYRFGDEALVEEMVEAVEGARGALPLLAFAVARLWERRDREKKLLKREDYEAIGGVAGALAQHAEAAMDRIGPERQATVREIFRNLVTAHGTRAVADREELLSAFPDRAGAEEVLRQLIDARLLTSYEVEGREGEASRHRVEVIHESLLRAWPRLVRWQAQDEEGAVLRDQLKQAAHLWDEKGRTRDLLWTGTAYREYELWRERYGGALTALEEDFARSMADRAARQRWRRRAVAVAIVAASLAVAGVTGLLWRRSQAEARRAEAGKLLALGRTELDRHPTAALAYVHRSLELADTQDARRFAVEVLWRGPVARILSPDRAAAGPDQPENPGWGQPVFSPDGKWLALENPGVQRLLLFPADGGAPRTVPRPPESRPSALGFGPHGDWLLAGGPGSRVQLWSLPDLRPMRSFDLGGVSSRGWLGGSRLHTFTRMASGDRQRLIRSWSLPEGEPTTLGVFGAGSLTGIGIDAEGRWMAYASGTAVHLRRLDGLPATERVLGSHANAVTLVTFVAGGDRVASADTSGEIRIWSVDLGASVPVRVLQGPKSPEELLTADPDGTHVAWAGVAGSVHVWDLRDPPDAEAIALKRPDAVENVLGGFDPSGRWLVASTGYNLAFWPATGPWRRTLPGYTGSTWGLAFSPDGRWLASCPLGEPVRLWPLGPDAGKAHALAPPVPCWGVEVDAAGKQALVVATPGGQVFLQPISEGPRRPLRTGWEGAAVFAGSAAFDPRGRRAIACPWDPQGLADPRLRSLSVWDLGSGQGKSFSLARFTDASWACDRVAFAPDGTALVAGNGGLLRVVLPDDPNGSVSAETLHAAGRASFTLSHDGQKLLVWAGRNPGAGLFEDLLLFDLATHVSQRITTHGRRLWTADFDPTGRVIVTADIDGVVRAGPATGEEPHLLLGGHTTMVTRVAVSPDGRWIASVSDEGLRLWPMPDVTKPPLHALPHDELIAKLDALTNVRVVRDPASATGWRLEVGPFPGWRDVPTW